MKALINKMSALVSKLLGKKAEYVICEMCNDVFHQKGIVYLKAPAKFFGYSRIACCEACAEEPDPRCSTKCDCGCDAIAVYDVGIVNRKWMVTTYE